MVLIGIVIVRGEEQKRKQGERILIAVVNLSYELILKGHVGTSEVLGEMVIVVSIGNSILGEKRVEGGEIDGDCLYPYSCSGIETFEHTPVPYQGYAFGKGYFSHYHVIAPTTLIVASFVLISKVNLLEAFSYLC